MQNSFHIIGIGAALIDTEIHVSEADLRTLNINKGHMTLVDRAQQTTYLAHLRDKLDSARHACGGSAANSLIVAAHMGCATHLTCQVGDDTEGQRFLNELSAAGISFNKNGQQTPEAASGRCLVLLTPDAERSLNTYLGASELLSERNIHPELFASAQWLLIEGYLATSATGQRAAKAMVQHAKAHGCKVVFTFSDPGIVTHFRDQMLDIMQGEVDMVICNLSEANAWAETKDLPKTLAKLAQLTPSFAITRSEQSALVKAPGENTVMEISPPPVNAVNTNGAGDAFAGALLAGLALGQSLAQSAQTACRFASYLCTQEGPRLSKDEIISLLEQPSPQ